jgi:hypothetical protein
MAENTEMMELQRRLHDAHESSARLRDRITELEGWVAEGKRNGTRCAEERDSAAELLAEIMRDEVNAQDEAEKWLRAYAPHLLFSENNRGELPRPVSGGGSQKGLPNEK